MVAVRELLLLRSGCRRVPGYPHEELGWVAGASPAPPVGPDRRCECAEVKTPSLRVPVVDDTDERRPGRLATRPAGVMVDRVRAELASRLWARGREDIVEKGAAGHA